MSSDKFIDLGPVIDRVMKAFPLLPPNVGAVVILVDKTHGDPEEGAFQMRTTSMNVTMAIGACQRAAFEWHLCKREMSRPTHRAETDMTAMQMAGTGSGVDPHLIAGQFGTGGGSSNTGL